MKEGWMLRRGKYLCMAAVIAVLFLFALGSGSVPGDFYYKNREELDAAAKQIAESKDVSGIEIKGVYNISYRDGENPIIEFTTSSSGLVPSSTYRGIYYSVSGEPAAFQNADIPLVETEKGWAWTGDGNKGGTTERIEGNWFVFDAHL